MDGAPSPSFEFPGLFGSAVACPLELLVTLRSRFWTACASVGCCGGAAPEAAATRGCWSSPRRRFPRALLEGPAASATWSCPTGSSDMLVWACGFAKERTDSDERRGSSRPSLSTCAG